MLTEDKQGGTLNVAFTSVRDSDVPLRLLERNHGIAPPTNYLRRICEKNLQQSPAGKPRMLIGYIRAIVYFAESSREFIDARKFSMLLAPLM